MDLSKKRTIILVSSPLQLLCAIEAIKEFNIENYDLSFLFLDNKEYNKNYGIIRLCDEIKMSYDVIINKSKIKFLLSSLFSRKKYDFSIIGNKNSLFHIIYSLFSLTRRSNIMYIDDGASSLINARKPITVELKTLFLTIIKKIKHINDRNFYTFFNVTNSNINIYKNNFHYLKSFLNKEVKNDIYLIGTNFSLLNKYYSIDYKELLIKTIVFLKRKYPNKNIIYCPHRRDDFLSEIRYILSEYNIEIFNTIISVEYDFVKNRIYPEAVYGYGSSALFSLKILFDDINIFNIENPFINSNICNSYKIIANELSQNGIKTIKMI